MRRFTVLLSLFAASWLAGCRTPAHPSAQADPAFYPIGLYCVDDTNDFATVRAAGFEVSIRTRPCWPMLPAT